MEFGLKEKRSVFYDVKSKAFSDSPDIDKIKAFITEI